MSNEIRALYSTLMRFIEDSRFLDITCKLKLQLVTAEIQIRWISATRIRNIQTRQYIYSHYSNILCENPLSIYKTISNSTSRRYNSFYNVHNEFKYLFLNIKRKQERNKNLCWRILTIIYKFICPTKKIFILFICNIN